MKTLFVLFVALTIQFSINFSIVKGKDLVEETCGKTKYPDVCVSTLKLDSRGSSADVKGLAQIVLDKVVNKTNEVFNIYFDLYKKYSSDPAAGRFYGTCLDAYGASMTRLLPEAISSLQSSNYGTAKTDSQSAASNALLCEQQFVNSPTSGQDTFVQQVSTVAADIISLLG